MSNNTFLYFMDDDCILFDRKSVSFFTIPMKIGIQLTELEPSECDQILEKVLASKRQSYPSLRLSTLSCDSISRLTIVLTQFCNLACKYCYADAGTYGDKCNSSMSIDTAKNAIDKMVEMFQGNIQQIQFFGGEPLLNYKVMEYICQYCYELYEKRIFKKLPQFTIVTNGTLINKHLLELFNKYTFDVTISLDGPKNVNDKQRIYQHSEGSVYDNVISTIDFLNENRNFNLSVEITLTRHFVELTKIEQVQFLELLKNKKIDYIHVVPVVIDETDELFIAESEKLKESMDLITDYIFKAASGSNKPFFMAKAADILKLLHNREKIANFCQAGIDNFAIDTQGDIYGCFMLISPDKKTCMGNVNNATLNLDHFQSISTEFKNATFDSCEECNDCILSGLCSNCVAASYSANAVLNKPVKNLCIAQKAIFERIGYHIAKNSSTKS